MPGAFSSSWRRALPLAGLAVIFFFAAAPSAHAARSGRVDVEGAEVFEGPGRGYTVLEKLTRGSRVTTSNYPTEGFYKVRTATGIVGWVGVDSLVVDDLPDPSDPSTQPRLNTPSTTDPAHPFQGKAPTAVPADFRNRRHSSFVRLRAFGSLTMFNAAEINQHFSFDGFKNGYGVGGEVNFRFTRDVSMVIRTETLGQNVVGQHGVAANKVYQFTTSAIPLMAGLEVTLTDESRFSSYFGAMAGVGLNTTVSTTLLGVAGEGRVTDYVSQTFTGLGRLLFAYHVSRETHFFAEVGYRLLRAEGKAPTTIGTGSEIWQNGGSYVQLPLDMSGLNLGLGIALHF